MLDVTKRYDVCVIGAGMAGALLAHALTARGRRVVLIEAGSRFEFGGRLEQLRRHQILNEPLWPWQVQGRDENVDASFESIGRSYNLNRTRAKAVGGSTLHWGGRAQRLRESDFISYRSYGMARDWPISYQDIEPYYCEAEHMIGVSGAANPDDPPRSRLHPMPAFPLGYLEQLWLPVLDQREVSWSRTGRATNSEPYQGRAPCLAFSVCNVCPSGARYSAEFHVNLAEATGLCDVLTETVARRLEVDASGGVRRLHAQTLSGIQFEVHAQDFVVACHAVESARLLLLSNLGNHSDQVGRNLMEHWYFGVGGYQSQQLYPSRIGFSTLESFHFYDGAERRERGAIKLELGEDAPFNPLVNKPDGMWGRDLARYDCEHFGHWLGVAVETEQLPNAESRVTLDSSLRDQFGDRVPHVRFAFTDIDQRTQKRAVEIATELLDARGVGQIEVSHALVPAAHHMGTCRMTSDPDEGVVDPNCQVHGVPNLYCAGSSVFPSGGACQPTLTIGALALRLADHLMS